MINGLFDKKKKMKIDPLQLKAMQDAKAAQEWMPIHDIKDHIAYRRDHHLVVAIRVQPVNIHLLSEKEQVVKIKSLHEALNGIDFPIQIFSVARPVDLDGYITKLEQKKDDADFKRKRLLDGYIKIAASKASSGEALERSFYVIFSQKKDKFNEAYIYEQALEIANNLSSAGLYSNVCDEQELRDLYFVLTHPVQASVERSPDSNFVLPMVYKGGA